MKDDFDGLEKDQTTCLLSTQRSANPTLKEAAGTQQLDEPSATFGKNRDGSVFSFAGMKLAPQQNKLKTQDSLMEEIEAQTENSTCNFELLRGRRLLQLAEVYTFGKTTSDSKRSMTNLGDQPYSSSQDLIENQTGVLDPNHLQARRTLEKKASGEDYSSPSRLSSEMRFHSTKLSSDLLRELRDDYLEEETPNNRQSGESPVQISLNIRKNSNRRTPGRGSPLGASNFLKFHIASMNEGEVASSSHKPRAAPKLAKSIGRARQTSEGPDEPSPSEPPRRDCVMMRKSKKHLLIEPEIPEEQSQVSSVVELALDLQTPQTSPHLKQRSTPELVKSKSVLLSESLAGRKPPINRLNSSELESQAKRKPRLPPIKQIQRIIQAEEHDQSQFSEMSEMKRSVLTPMNQATTPPAKAFQRANDLKTSKSTFQQANEAAASARPRTALFSSTTASKLMLWFALSIFLAELCRSATN